ncbi:nucleoside phosphorylase [Pleurocapsa sp. PCC 7327]|uniref:5'-methylthioadenosine/S-adenosylhomocysteine nucleosidase family protein n=1 Tax=Pleurocapsa sp. PCC 7327 TaxID=118163 RepID=UPI00029FA59D|nr:nucleoside phosphorylase [Pleurocapsa sp. PCC 7327]AFY76877.1 nucleoside phosphorylase [Pleurocapsa sp. PCC 7327]
MMWETARKPAAFASNVDRILVPQGTEYRAICRGLQSIDSQKPLGLPIPIGVNALTPYLEKWQQTKDFLNKPPARILLMGLCGSLSPQYSVGDLVIYQACGYRSEKLLWRECDFYLTKLLGDRLQGKATLVKGLTSDRVIWSAQEKSYLGRICQADVVDMEGYAALEILARAGIALAIIRVISDDCQQDLPNIMPAIGSDGSLQPFPLAMKMLQNPVAAIRLIQGSLRGLKVLQQVTSDLFSEELG